MRKHECPRCGKKIMRSGIMCRECRIKVRSRGRGVRSERRRAGEVKAKIAAPVLATLITMSVILIACWHLGLFPWFLLIIAVSVTWGWVTAIGMLFCTTWVVMTFWLYIFNRKRKRTPGGSS